MPKSTLTSRGQVTIPKEVRDRWGLKQGDQLVCRFDAGGKLTVEEMKEAMRARVRAKVSLLR
jgi:AbrB family looped-hinge helix DNA binding protein